MTSKYPSIMEHTLYKLKVQGIVFLVDPITTIAYRYDTTEPVGRIVWTDLGAEPRLVVDKVDPK
jgi:hypothetical protein